MPHGKEAQVDAVDVVAVVGGCAPERRRYARRLAMAHRRMLVPAARLAKTSEPAELAAALAGRAAPSAGAVVEFPGDVAATDIIGALAHADSGIRLSGLICVVDATHLLDDLNRPEYTRPRSPRLATDLIATALLVATQLEYASSIVLVNWAALDTPRLSLVMALVSHLSPRARLRLHREGIEAFEEESAYSEAQERPGWIGILNSDFAPHMTDRRVSALRYEHVRPLHPGRLATLLDRVEAGEFGIVVRSAGFCRLATRPQASAHWEHVGQTISLFPLAEDGHIGDDEELLAIGQELAFIGLDLRHEALHRALDETVLSDAELAAGPAAWSAFADPFPAWQTVPDRAD